MGRLKRIAALRGVVLASGGFESAPEIQRKYWQIRPVLPVATRGNTGDGIRMAQAAGADLWHMWHFHGSYGFKHPDPNYPYALRVKRLPDWNPTVKEPDVRMSWIILDGEGRRFMNEYHPYLQDTGQRPLDQFDPVTQQLPEDPGAHRHRRGGPQALPARPGGGERPQRRALCVERRQSEGSRQRTSEEGGKHRGTGELSSAPIRPWCARASSAGTPRSRPATMPIRPAPPARCSRSRSRPSMSATLWPVVNNTQGGPAHDARQRVVNAHGEPIPRLYEAGELGSIWGFLYLGAGNLAECFVTGQIAGGEAAAQRPWANAPELTAA